MEINRLKKGFRTSFSTTDHQLLEKREKFNILFYLRFVDLAKLSTQSKTQAYSRPYTYKMKKTNISVYRTIYKSFAKVKKDIEGPPFHFEEDGKETQSLHHVLWRTYLGNKTREGNRES